MLGEGCGREEADTYRSYGAQQVSLARQAVPPPSGRGAPPAGRAGAGKGGERTQVEAAQGLKTPGGVGWRPFAGSCFGSSVLLEAPGAGHLDCAARGLRRPNAHGPGTASSIEGKPAWCEDHVLLIWPCTTLVCFFLF